MLKCNATYTWQSVLKGPRSQHCISVFHYPTLVTVPIAIGHHDFLGHHHQPAWASRLVCCANHKEGFPQHSLFFSTRAIYFIHWFFQSCLWHWKSRMIPTPPHGRSPPPPFPMGPGFLFFLLIPMVIMEFLCLVSMHNGVINYVAIGVSSTQCVQPICASQRGGGRGHTCWKTSIHTGPKECTSHGSLLDL